MSSFDDRKKGFEKKFVRDEEMQFKVNAKRNKYLGEWVAEKLGKKDQNKEIYVQEVIKSDFAEPGDEDVFKKVKADLNKVGFENIDDEIRNKMNETMERAKKYFS